MSVTFAQCLIIMFGGALGALARYLMTITISNRFGDSFPLGTLSVNVLGSFFMGFLVIVLIERFEPDPLVKLGILVGFLGAFTTFSTFSLETLNLFNQGQQLFALANIFLSVCLSVLAVWLGVLLGKTFV